MNSSLFTPDYSHLTGLLQHLNDEELKELLNSDVKLKTIVHDLKQVHDIEAEREMLLTSNKSISEYNLSKKPILEDHRKQVEETRKIALELKDSLLDKKRKIESMQPVTNNETLLALLQTASSEKEEEAEASVQMFLQKELSVEEFLPKYLEVRKLAHLRRIKAEKLTSILQENGSRVIAPTPPQRPRKSSMPPVLPPPPSSHSYVNPVAQNNTPMPVRQAPQPPVYNMHPAPYPPGVPNQMRPGTTPYPPGVPNQMRPGTTPYPPGVPNQVRPGAAPYPYGQPYPPYGNPYVPRFPTYR